MAALLDELRDSDALRQEPPRDVLEHYHVEFDRLTRTNSVEGRLRHWMTRGGRVALSGTTGSGKTSTLAAVFGAFAEDFPEHLAPIRVPVGVADDAVVTEPVAFARHVLGYILDWAGPAQAAMEPDLRGVRRAMAATVTRRGAVRRSGFSFGAAGGPVNAKLSGDIARAAPDLQEEATAGDVARALQGLVSLFREREVEPLLIFDDADIWLRHASDDETRRLADAFFDVNIRTLATELDIGFVLAVQPSYGELPGYQALADRLEPVVLPVLEPAVPALRSIFDHRLELHGLRFGLDDAFAEPAIDLLAELYGELPDLRRTLAIASGAVQRTLEDTQDQQVRAPAIRAAATERDGFAGR